MFDILWSFEALVFLGCLPWYLVDRGVWMSLKNVQSLPSTSLDREKSYPRLSVIIAARNEAGTIENALKSVLAQNYPNLEIILVNDRSNDGTDKILQKIAEKDPRVLIHHVEELPLGWLGKVNAMQQGFGRSTGVWLLFTDADVHFQEESLERIIDVAERSSVDYLCVIPEVQARQRLLKALYTVSLSAFFLATRIWEVKNQNSFVGVGACGLVRRSLLSQSPGLPWLKMEVVDDLALAQLAWQVEGKLDVYWGRECLGVEWYPSMGDLIRGLEKNLFAGAQYQYWRALLGIIGILFVAVAPWLSIFSGNWLLSLTAVVAFSGYWLAWISGDKAQGVGWLERLISPLLLFVIAWALARSTFITWRQGGIQWRETFYSLADLRRGQRLKF
ncbi:MAG: glycosyltransferase family 2 protein [SAR324 cluster bacterium]|nr:glycosyltransferase family 2 protein [SAR324 cluster bacterium]